MTRIEYVWDNDRSTAEPITRESFAAGLRKMAEREPVFQDALERAIIKAFGAKP